MLSRHMQSLLQHVLTRHDRMHGLIREAHPNRSRGEWNTLLLSMPLVVHVPLHAIVQLKHQMVVLTPK